MKIENAPMRGFYSGLIAGIVGGIILSVSMIATEVWVFGTWTAIYDKIISPELVMNYIIYHIGYAAIFGGIFGIFYSIFYNRIPGKGIKRGFIFGCMIGLLSNIWIAFGEFLTGLFTGIEIYYDNSFGWAWVFVFLWLTYGLVLGLVYERLNL